MTQLGDEVAGVDGFFLLDLGQEAQHYGLYFGAGAALFGFLLYRWTKTDAGGEL